MAESAGHTLYTFGELPDLNPTTNLKMSIRGSYTSEITQEVIFPATGRTVADQSAFIAPLDFPTGNTDFQLTEAISSQFSPTLRIAELFYSENGVPIDEDTSYDFKNRFETEIAPDDPVKKFYVQPGFTTAKLNLNREARFYASLGFDGGIWFGQDNNDDNSPVNVRAKFGERAGAKDLPSFNRYSATGYFAKKLVHYETTMAGGNNIVPLVEEIYPWPIIRLADLYLMYAEALNESLSNPTVEIYEYIDLVRNRAGLDGVLNSWNTYSSNPSKPTTKDGLREIIHQERMIELVFEGSRFWDLRRWKKAVNYMNTPIRGWNVFGDSSELYYKVQTLLPTKFFCQRLFMANRLIHNSKKQTINPESRDGNNITSILIMELRNSSLFSLAIFLSIIACQEEVRGPLFNDGQNPGQITNLTFEPKPGGAKIMYKLPTDKDLLLVRGEYTLANGEKATVKSSRYNNSLEIVGLLDSLNTHTVKLVSEDSGR